MSSVSNFGALHYAIQDAFGWQQRHLYEFRYLDQSNERIKSTPLGATSYPLLEMFFTTPDGTEAKGMEVGI